MFDIVLIAPEIPQNTGTIGRLCVCTDARLHLIRPLGFSLDAARVRRAGLDYWPYLQVQVYDTWAAFLEKNQPERMSFFSTRGKRELYEHHFGRGEYLVFGNETSGFPPHFYQDYTAHLLTIPMPGKHARSHNLANAVSVVLYEALRQVSWRSDTGSERG